MIGQFTTPYFLDGPSQFSDTFAPEIIYNSRYNAELLFEAVLFYTIGCVGFLGNLMVVIVIFQYTKMRQIVTNVYVINQSLIDGAAGLILILTRVFQFKFDEPVSGAYGEFVCRVWASKIPLWSLLLSSTCNLMALTLERYIAVMHPIYHKISFTRTKVMGSVIVVWISGPFIQLCYKASTGGLTEDGRCLILSRWPNPFTQHAVSTFLITMEFIFPLMFIGYAYTRLFLKLKLKVSTVGVVMNQQGTNSDRNVKTRKNILKTMIIVSLSYFFCWVWNQSYYFGVGIGILERDQTSMYVAFSVFMVYINCCVNPIIYVIHYDQFKKGIRLLKKRVTDKVSTIDVESGSSQSTDNTTNVTD